MRLTLLLLILSAFTSLQARETPERLPPGVSLQRLVEGNERFMEAMARHPNQNLERREKLAAGQFPFAVIVACADSRVAPEIVFDQGLGDVFVVRVAGNVVGPLELDSIEFATKHLGASLVIVMGHEGCGAVNAILHGTAQNFDIENVIPFIQPLVAKAKEEPGDPLVNLTKLNVQNVVRYLKSTVIINNLLKDNHVDIIGAYYHLISGEVELLR